MISNRAFSECFWKTHQFWYLSCIRGFFTHARSFIVDIGYEELHFTSGCVACYNPDGLWIMYGLVIFVSVLQNERRQRTLPLCRVSPSRSYEYCNNTKTKISEKGCIEITDSQEYRNEIQIITLKSPTDLRVVIRNTWLNVTKIGKYL